MKLSRFINKFTILSIRKSDELITTGNVKVNDKVVLQPFYLLKENDKVTATINQKVYQFTYPKEFKAVYYVFNKPKGCEITLIENKNFPTLIDYLKSNKIVQKVFYVGRLDFNSSGLLLLTNDGIAANKIIHPSNNIEKTYFVEVKGIVPSAVFKKISTSKTLIKNELFSSAKFKNIKYFEKTRKTSFLIILSEGKNRHIHRLFDFYGFKVLEIKRIAIGGLYLKNLHLKRGKIKEIKYSLLKKIFNL